MNRPARVDAMVAAARLFAPERRADDVVGAGSEAHPSRRADAAMAGLAVLFVGAVKAAFMNAPAEAFRWLLAPTVALTSALTGHPFFWEQGVGYVNLGLHYSIAAACSGLTFFAASSGALICLLGTRRASMRARLGWAMAGVALAFVTTVLANTVRLVTALALLEHGASLPFIDAENSHRLLGIAVYLVALVLVVQHARGPGGGPSPLLLALAWYAGVTLLLPALRGQAHGREFALHAVSIAAACACLVSLKHGAVRVFTARPVTPQH